MRVVAEGVETQEQFAPTSNSSLESAMRWSRKKRIACWAIKVRPIEAAKR